MQLFLSFSPSFYSGLTVNGQLTVFFAPSTTLSVTKCTDKGEIKSEILNGNFSNDTSVEFFSTSIRVSVGRSSSSDWNSFLTWIAENYNKKNWKRLLKFQFLYFRLAGRVLCISEISPKYFQEKPPMAIGNPSWSYVLPTWHTRYMFSWIK